MALKHHVTHRGDFLDFKDHKYLTKIYYDKSPYIVIKKSTQCGVSEYLIVRALGKAIQGFAIFYVLPTFDLVGRFVKNRIDKTTTKSEFYKAIEIKSKEVNSKVSGSVRLKDVGKGSIAFVGSNSTAGFTEYPADEVIIDELDECDQDNIGMAWERMSHSKSRNEIKVANPTIEGFGIDKEFSETNMQEWAIKCECGIYVVLDWFRHIVRREGEHTYIIRDSEWEWGVERDINTICHKCSRPLNRKGEGRWESNYASLKKGYQISKLFSGTISILEMVNRFNKGLVNDSKLKRFYNADLGLAFTAKGAKIASSMLNDILGNHYNFDKNISGVGVAGLDVGSVSNLIIGKVQPDGRIIVTCIDTIATDDEEILRKLYEYGVKLLVMDALPERLLVSKLKNKFSLTFSCFYADPKKDNVDNFRNITIDRTKALDALKESILIKLFVLPCDAPNVLEFYNQMEAPTRVFEQKLNKGRGAYIWTEGSKPDHYFHAMSYCLLAKQLLVRINR